MQYQGITLIWTDSCSNAAKYVQLCLFFRTSLKIESKYSNLVIVNPKLSLLYKPFTEDFKLFLPLQIREVVVSRQIRLLEVW